MGVVVVDQRSRDVDGHARAYCFLPVAGDKDVDWFALLKLLGMKLQDADPDTYELMDLEDADNCGG